MTKNPIPLRSFSDEDTGFSMSIPLDATTDEAFLEGRPLTAWTVNIVLAGDGLVQVTHIISRSRHEKKQFALPNNFFSNNWEEMERVIGKHGGQMFSGSAMRIANRDAARMTFLLPNGEMNDRFSIWVAPDDQFEIYFSAPEDKPIAEELMQAMLATFTIDV